tara:strand:- start:4588 stop:5349 length:762 start_codon:yes stop_codon:yes gene_type:complete
MNLKKHTTTEKFEMLSFLQSRISIGNYLVTFLKIKKVYQLSFVNGIEYKSRGNDLDIVLENGIEKVAKIYKKIVYSDFYTDFVVSKERVFQEMQTLQIRELNDNINQLTDKINNLEKNLKRSKDYNKAAKDKIEELENNYSNDIVKNEEETTNKFIDSSGDSFTPGGFLSFSADEILKPIDDILSDFKKQRGQKNTSSKLFTENELYLEMIRKHSKFRNISDVIEFKNEFIDEFKLIRKRAYDTLYKRKNNKK